MPGVKNPMCNTFPRIGKSQRQERDIMSIDNTRLEPRQLNWSCNCLHLTWGYDKNFSSLNKNYFSFLWLLEVRGWWQTGKYKRYLYSQSQRHQWQGDWYCLLDKTLYTVPRSFYSLLLAPLFYTRYSFFYGGGFTSLPCSVCFVCYTVQFNAGKSSIDFIEWLIITNLLVTCQHYHQIN